MIDIDRCDFCFAIWLDQVCQVAFAEECRRVVYEGAHQ